MTVSFWLPIPTTSTRQLASSCLSACSPVVLEQEATRTAVARGRDGLLGKLTAVNWRTLGWDDASQGQSKQGAAARVRGRAGEIEAIRDLCFRRLGAIEVAPFNWIGSGDRGVGRDWKSGRAIRLNCAEM